MRNDTVAFARERPLLTDVPSDSSTVTQTVDPLAQRIREAAEGDQEPHHGPLADKLPQDHAFFRRDPCQVDKVSTNYPRHSLDLRVRWCDGSRVRSRSRRFRALDMTAHD